MEFETIGESAKLRKSIFILLPLIMTGMGLCFRGPACLPRCVGGKHDMCNFVNLPHRSWLSGFAMVYWEKAFNGALVYATSSEPLPLSVSGHICKKLFPVATSSTPRLYTESCLL